MNALKFLIVIVLLYMAQSYYLMSNGHVKDFIEQAEMKSMQDPVAACEYYSDDVEVNMNLQAPGGHWEVEGGKDELCGFIRQNQAAAVVMQSDVNWTFDNVKINSRFPWQNAKADYEMTGSQTVMGHTIQSHTKNAIEIKRTLTGLKITKVNVTGGAG
ncbi:MULTISPECIES: hypothetical protein [unclassified Acinetobacter]|uniref:hypothetical protein n=1 Tax=unclassified Acinetobacter TaxID=196816 RepID=UPI0035B8E788